MFHISFIDNLPHKHILTWFNCPRISGFCRADATDANLANMCVPTLFCLCKLLWELWPLTHLKTNQISKTKTRPFRKSIENDPEGLWPSDLQICRFVTLLTFMTIENSQCQPIIVTLQFLQSFYPGRMVVKPRASSVPWIRSGFVGKQRLAVNIWFLLQIFGFLFQIFGLGGKRLAVNIWFSLQIFGFLFQIFGLGGKRLAVNIWFSSLAVNILILLQIFCFVGKHLAVNIWIFISNIWLGSSVSL